MTTQSSQIFGIFNIFFSFPKATYTTGSDVRDVVLKEGNKKAPSITIGDYEGKWLVLFFYPMDNSPGCTKEAKTFSTLIEDFHQQNAEVIGISTNSEEKHQAFIEKHNLKVNLITDSDGVLAKLFGIKILFGMCSRDSVIVNPKGQVEAIYNGVSPSSSPQQILNQIKEKNAQPTSS